MHYEALMAAFVTTCVLTPAVQRGMVQRPGQPTKPLGPWDLAIVEE